MAVTARAGIAVAAALAAATVMAVSPVAAHPEHAELRAADIELAVASAPAFGALPYQVVVNQIASIAALAPIVVGSIESCAACLPVTPQNPFTGYGALGVGVGLLSSPVAFVNTLVSTGNVVEALGVAALAIQTPITNTFLQLVAPRSLGGFNIEGTITRALTAINDTVMGLLNIAAQALVAGPIAVIGGAVSAAQVFASTLAATGNVVTAFNAGTTVVRNAVTGAVVDLAGSVQNTRAQVYADLTQNPPALAGAATAARKAAARKAEPAAPRTATATARAVASNGTAAKTAAGAAAGPSAAATRSRADR